MEKCKEEKQMDTIEVVGSGQSLVDAILKTPHMPTKYEYQPTP